MRGFSPSRLRIARQRNELLCHEFARACSVTPQTASNWETGKTSPDAARIELISEVLRFPPEFFLQPAILEVPEEAASFRSRARVPARAKHAALAAGAMACELAEWIEDRFELPQVAIPEISDEHPERVAEAVRAEWRLGDRPISNMIQLLESRGVLVFSLVQDSSAIDAFSFWVGSRPVVMLNTTKSSERSRMDAAHELMHLIAHREGTGKKEEAEANHFAGAFLMPRRGIYADVPTLDAEKARIVSIPRLMKAKAVWGVSLAAISYRLHKLGLLKDWQYRTLFVKLSQRGYRAQEPQPMPRERSVLLDKVFGSLRGSGILPRDLAHELSWRNSELNALIFGLGTPFASIDGLGKATSATEGHLKAVEGNKA